MKKVLSILASASVIFAACSKPESGDNNQNPPIDPGNPGEEGFTPKPAYIWCDNSEVEGSYIDFGSAAEFVNFGEEITDYTYQFSVDFWAYLPAWGSGWFSILFAATQNDVATAGGWGVNQFDGGQIRGVHIAANEGGGYQWRETAMARDGDYNIMNYAAGAWHHYCLVYVDRNVENRPDGYDIINVFLDGEKMCGLNLDDNNLGYAADNAGISHMFAFARTSNDLTEEGAAIPNGGYSTGSIRDIHLWSKALSRDEISDLCDEIMDVNKDTPNLVAGWTLDSTVEDPQNIPDITGKYSAKLVGENISFVEGILR